MADLAIRQTIGKWGNAAGIRLPAKLVTLLGLEPGADVLLSMEGDALVIRPARARLTLEQLLEGVTPEINDDDEIRDWQNMPSVGAERDI